MRRIAFTLIAFSFITGIFGQEKKKMNNSKNDKWKKGGMFSLIGGQGGSRNWAAGSEKFSFAAAASLSLYANTTCGKGTWDNSIDLRYAMVNASSLGIRKNDDKIDFYSKYGYPIKHKLFIGAAYNLRTQFTNSYDYTESPKKRTGGFFAPAYITFGPGIDYRPCADFSVFFTPIAARWVITTNRPYSFNNQGGMKPDGTEERSVADLYGVDPEKKVRFEAGPYVSASYHKNIMKNIYLKSRLDINSDFAQHTAEKLDWYWTNTVTMKVNRWIQVVYNFDVIYDDDVRQFGANKNSAALQLNSMLGVGIAAKF